MESNSVKNKYTALKEQYISLIETYFKNNLDSYKLLGSDISSGYWIVDFYEKNADLKIQFYGDPGWNFFIYIYIYGVEYRLSQFDSSVANKTEANVENILYQLNALKQVLANELFLGTNNNKN